MGRGFIGPMTVCVVDIRFLSFDALSSLALNGSE